MCVFNKQRGRIGYNAQQNTHMTLRPPPPAAAARPLPFFPPPPTQTHTQAIEPEWGTLGELQLDYCPVDFFSGEGPRVARALRALLRNPQARFFLNLCLLGGSPPLGAWW